MGIRISSLIAKERMFLAKRRAASNVKQARKLQILRVKRIRKTGQEQLRSKIASEKAAIRALGARRAAIRAARVQRAVSATKRFTKKAKKVKQSFGGFSFE